MMFSLLLQETFAMFDSPRLFAIVVGIALCAAFPVAAPAQSNQPPRAAEPSDAIVFANLCFQCHGPGMWSDHRLDRRAWEGMLYRMVGRGALWTDDEIRRMANHLAATFGAQPAKPSK
jgi:hypothetical protein